MTVSSPALVGTGDPAVTGARRAVELAEHVRRIVAAAPPLTAEQRDRIAALLRPVPTQQKERAQE